MWSREFLFHLTLSLKTLLIHVFVFNWVYFIWCLFSFPSAHFLMLFQKRYSQSTLSILLFSLDTLTSSQFCLFYLFLSHNPTLFYTEASLHRVILIKLLVSVSFESPISLKQDVPLHHAAFGCYFADCYGFCGEIRDVAWEDMLGFGADMFCLSSSICQTCFC